MRICCSKCKKVLTIDLFQTKLKTKKSNQIKRFKKGESELDKSFLRKLKARKIITRSKNVFHVERSDFFVKTRMKKNCFVNHKNNKKNYICISEDSLLENIMPTGDYDGCCSWCSHPLMCSCQSHLGTLSLDCWQIGWVALDEKKVDRIYKR